MNKEAIRIPASKPFAIVFIPVLLICSVWGTVVVLQSDYEWWIIAVILIVPLFFGAVALFGAYTLLSKKFIYTQAKQHSGGDNSLEILITPDEIICHYTASNKTERIKWDEIDQIKILTTDEDPAVCDVFIVLQNSTLTKGVALPQDREEAMVVFEKIQHWPDFDNETFIKAMASSENKWFQVWKRNIS